MEQIAITKLKPHPMNSQFFDDITGDSWTLFLESIKTSGVIEPIIATTNYIVVSGHQRLRACKELGIKEVPVVLRFYADDDAILKDLIETNLRQRGNVSGNQIKLSKCFNELERIYGIKHGNNQRNVDSNNVGVLTQQELLDRLGINKETYRQIKQLANLPQEIQDMVESGKITPSTASRVIARLSPDEQLQLIEELPAKDKFTQKEIEKLASELAESKRLLKMYEKNLDDINSQNAELRNRVQATPQQSLGVDLSNDCTLICARIDSFIKDLGGYVYLTNHLADLTDVQWKQFIMSVQSVNAWASNILNFAFGKENTNEQ